MVNAGAIGSLGGDITLIARKVTNNGTLSAPNGTAALAAGTEVLVLDKAQADGGHILVKVGGADDAVTNSGRIAAAVAELRANGGNVYALAGNTGGTVSATGTAIRDGRILLTAGKDGTTEVSGTLQARKGTDGSASGGTIVATGGAVHLTGTAKLDASGAAGGTILVGGDYQGGRDPATKTQDGVITTARTTTVDKGAVLTADSTAGKGGTVVVWSDEKTGFEGAISARGTGQGGGGGTAEVSGKAVLAYKGTTDLTAENGQTGTLLLDPHNLTITTDAKAGDGTSATYDNSGLKVSTLENALGTANVIVSTGSTGTQAGDIVVDSDVTWATNTLTLQAAGNIRLNKSLTGTNNAGLVLDYGTGKGYVLHIGAKINLAGTGASLTIGGTGYTLIQDKAGLDSIGIDTAKLSGNYALAGDLDLSGSHIFRGRYRRRYERIQGDLRRVGASDPAGAPSPAAGSRTPNTPMPGDQFPTPRPWIRSEDPPTTF